LNKFSDCTAHAIIDWIQGSVFLLFFLVIIIALGADLFCLDCDSLLGMALSSSMRIIAKFGLASRILQASTVLVETFLEANEGFAGLNLSYSFMRALSSMALQTCKEAPSRQKLYRRAK
jgi:hypothetical protein